MLRVLTTRPTELNGFDFGTGNTGIAPDQSVKRPVMIGSSGASHPWKALVGQIQSVNSPVDMAWNPKNATLAILGYDASLQLWALAF